MTNKLFHWATPKLSHKSTPDLHRHTLWGWTHMPLNSMSRCWNTMHTYHMDVEYTPWGVWASTICIASSLGLRSTTQKSWKYTPALHWRNSVRVGPIYAHPQHFKVLKHFAYICNDCEMQSKGVWRADQQTKQQEYIPKTDISKQNAHLIVVY